MEIGLQIGNMKPILKPVLQSGSCHNGVTKINQKKENIMKTLSRNLITLSAKITRNIRVILLVATLVLFVLAAGAPSMSGTVGG